MIINKTGERGQSTLIIQTMTMKYIVFFLIVNLFAGCWDRYSCDRPSGYFLNIPLSITPTSEVLKVGDTLNIRMHVDNNNIYDSEGGEIVDVEDFDPNAGFFLARIDTYPEGEGLKLNEVIITEEYDAPYVPFSKRYSGAHLFRKIIQENDYSTIDFNIVLREPGNYMFIAQSWIYRNSKDIIIEGRCRQLEHSVFVKWIISDEDVHEEMLTDTLKENVELYWSRNSGDRSRSYPYYFTVE